MRFRFRVFVFSWLFALSPARFVPAHAPDQPKFRSGVEVTSIDVKVVDGSGRPIAKAIPDSGRLVLIVIDQPNIRFGGAIGHRAAINKFIDRLHPSGPIGVINLGAGARSSSFTTDRNEVKRILATSVGGVPYSPSDKTSGEETGDILRRLMRAVREIDAPKTIVLVSQGLVFSEYLRPSIAALEREAAAARTTIYALRLAERVQNIMRKDPDPRLGPAETGGPSAAERLPDTPFPEGPAGDFGPGAVEAGGELEAIAAATGGAMFTIATNADRALARIESELSGSYLLAIESTAADGDGRPHSLNVDVSRGGVTVRAGRYLPSRGP